MSGQAMPKDGCPPHRLHIKMPPVHISWGTNMRRWMVWGTAAATCMAALAQAQSVPPAAAASDSWSRPASSSSVSYGSGAVLPRDQQHSSFRFKDEDKNSGVRIRADSPARYNGRPDTSCTSRPTASNCQSVGTRPPGR